MKNPFGDEAFRPGPPKNPFLDEPEGDPASTIEHASARIRRLRNQIGSDGLTLNATRDLIDQLTTALDAVARALREGG
jgi:hypothetical protein